MTGKEGVVRIAVEDRIAIVTIDHPPVNSLSASVRRGLRDRLSQADADAGADAIVILCDGKTFVAGADITELGKPMESPLLSELIAQIEGSAKPVVAALHGTALGGGLELALACHCRVATESARCGLPEVKLGLIAGAGGTQRLPRAVGVERALEMATSGQPMAGEELLESGLVDALVAEDGLRAGAVAFAKNMVAQTQPPVLLRNRDEKLAAAYGDPGLFDRFRAANARRFKGFDAPEASIAAIEAAIAQPFEEGLLTERRLFDALRAGSQSEAQRYFFFAERQAAKLAHPDGEAALRPISSVGIVGAGTMGGGIAMNFLSAGIPVTIVETRQEALDKGMNTIRRNYEGSARSGRISAGTVERNMALLTGSLSLDALADADLIIEAVFEDMGLKKDIFGRLDTIAKPGAILATNTSYLDVDEIAAATRRAGDVVGMHFFSPANIMRLLEVVRGEKTAPDVLVTVMRVARTIGKAAVISGVCFGFIGNRILTVRRAQSRALLLEGYLPWEIDKVLTDFGMPMGPYAMADLAGLDIGWSPGKSCGDVLRDRMCGIGRFGQKSGAGFYDYDENRRPTPSPVTEALVRAYAAGSDRPRRTLDDATMLQRMTYPMINEGVKIVEEGIAARASDIDVAWVTGYGWPVYRGGPMFYADLVGLPHVVETLDRFAREIDADLAPAAMLRDLAASGGRLSSI